MRSEFVGVAAFNAFRAMCEGYSSSDIARMLIDHGLANGETDSKINSTAAHVRNANNPDKDEFWKFCEVAVVMWQTGNHEPLFWLHQLLGYKTPERMNAAEELELVRAHNRRLESELEESHAREGQLVEQLNGGAELMKVVGHKFAGGGHDRAV